MTVGGIVLAVATSRVVSFVRLISIFVRAVAVCVTRLSIVVIIRRVVRTASTKRIVFFVSSVFFIVVLICVFSRRGVAMVRRIVRTVATSTVVWRSCFVRLLRSRLSVVSFAVCCSLSFWVAFLSFIFCVRRSIGGLRSYCFLVVGFAFFGREVLGSLFLRLWVYILGFGYL